VEIFDRLAGREHSVLATRVSEEQVAAVVARFPAVEHNHLARTLVLRREGEKLGKGTIGIISAGTSDIPVAEEAAVTADVMGNDVTRLFDVGVAGCIACSRTAKSCAGRACCSVRGMEGALPSVSAGWWRAGDRRADQRRIWRVLWRNCGAAGNDQLLRLQCVVVNIDNGFGAAYVASLINRL